MSASTVSEEGPSDSGPGDTSGASAGGDTSDSGVEKTRAWTGLCAVIAGDVAIALAAILGITHFATTSTANSQILPQIVAILSSAFTAIGTMTTAYFGIKSMANTAKNLAGPPTGNVATGSGNPKASNQA
jgi:hypothetical protein